MTRNNLHKDLLSEVIIGDARAEMNEQILETEEVKSLMYHQWKNPQEVEVSKKPDFKKIFESVKAKAKPENTQKSLTAQFFISEIRELKEHNRGLRKRLMLTISIAASVILLIGVGIAMLYLTDSTIGKWKHNKGNLAVEQVYSATETQLGQKSQIVLPDGTKVYLNSGTVLKYDNFFGTKYRTLELSGEAYFEVTRNEKMPFIIKTEDVEVEVLGTRFNVMAYYNDETIETTVAEGEVTVRDKHSRSAVLLKANQKATFNKNSREMLREEVNPETEISWKDNVLTFDNENFSHVIKKLERWYDVSIDVQGTDSIADRYTMTIKRESLNEVLNLISRTTNIAYRIKDDRVTIMYK